MTQGETDLEAMLSTIVVDRRPGSYCFVAAEHHLEAHAEASVREDEGLCLVVPVDVAVNSGQQPDFVAAWLTLRVHSALQAVGLTAAVSRVLTEANIACNVLAGRLHDHLLVPEADAERAIQAIESLRKPSN